jgi:hypothetical protein
MLAILNVGEGDTKVTFEKDKPEELERAKSVVNDMLKRGYAILVHAGEKDGVPIYYRATAFDENTLEYIVAGVPEVPPNQVGDDEEVEPAPKPKGRYKGGSRKAARLPATNRAVGVARTAGGMSNSVNSIEYKNIEQFDKFAVTRNALRKLSASKGEWCGLPMPIEGHALMVDPKYPFAELYADKKDEVSVDEHLKVWHYRNCFYSHKMRCDIYIYQNIETKRIKWVWDAAVNNFKQQLFTMGASDAWGIEQEANAVQLLATLLPHHRFKKYLLTGSFVEQSVRSGVTYLFRKLRPTIAAVPSDDGFMKILAALCMHPIAYYKDCWAGAMCPTDDVIAHLCLMRGDEHMYWRRCNQHRAYRPEAGL